MFIICQLTKERGKTWFNIGVTQWRFFVSMNSLWNIRPSLLLYIKITIKMSLWEWWSYKWRWRKTWRRPALILHLHLQVHLQCFNLLLPASLQSLSFGCRFPHLLSFRGPTSQELRAPKVLLEVCQVAFLLVLCSIFLHPLSSTSNSLQLRHVVT